MRAFDNERGAIGPGTRAVEASLEAAGFGRVRRFSTGQSVLTQGVPGKHAALILNGLVKVTLPSTSGAEVALGGKMGTLLSIRGPGDFVGEEAAMLDEVSLAEYPHGVGSLTVTALTPGSARVLPADDLRRFFLHEGYVLLAAAGALCERLADAEARLASAVRDNADCRLARLLCDLERHGIPDYNWGPGTQLPLRLSQAELASWIGSCRETVDRTFARWRRRRIISTRRRTIIVHDLEALARIAGIQVSRQAWSLTRGPRGRTIA